jgi:hypothetical protein
MRLPLDDAPMEFVTKEETTPFSRRSPNG